jgi:tetratricopeptide (TPR) repeat protein
MHQGLLDKDVGNLGNIRAALVLSYYEMGEIKKADLLFRKWLELEPDWGWGWIAWSDCFWIWKFLGLKTDFDKAEKILGEGLSIPNVHDKDHLLERLQELLQEKEKA